MRQGSVPVEPMERRSGVAMWRQIADAIRLAIAEGLPDRDGRLPAEKDLAARYAVNRHTVRAAIRSLVEEGVLEAQQGRGTFVRRRKRLVFPIGARTRFSSGLAGQASDLQLAILEEATEPASTAIAGPLQIAPGDPVARVETVSRADQVGISRATLWFPARRFSDIAAGIGQTGSVTRALAAHGVDDYVRAWTRLEARHGRTDDLNDLGLSPGAILMFAESLNADLDGKPIQYSLTRFAADRVTLTVMPESHSTA